MTFDLAVVLAESRSAHPDKPLCHVGDGTFSYAQVDEISGRIATSLRNPQGRRGNGAAEPAAARAPEVSYHLQDSESRLLITFETFADEAMHGARDIKGRQTYVVDLPGNDQRPDTRPAPLANPKALS